MTPTVSTTVQSSCQLQIAPMNDNICQLRIDFTTFVITGPSTTSIYEAHHQLGTIPLNAAGNVPTTVTNWRSNCLLDTFSVNGVTSANNPPTICGVNTGYHMYVDANNDDGNTMLFQFAAFAGAAPAAGIIDTRGVATLAARDWDITVYQYECGHLNAAPPGCTQYFWGLAKTTGRVTTYNYGAGAYQHLANQNQKVCIRRERGFCYACFARDGNSISFTFSGSIQAVLAIVGLTFVMPSQTGGFGGETAAGVGAANKQAGSYDVAIIPGAFVVGIQASGVWAAITTTAANIRTLAAATYQMPCAPHQSSAGAFGPGTVPATGLQAPTIIGNAVLTTICTKHVPFMFQFKSDDFEGTGNDGEYGDEATNVVNPGINLNYELISCT